MSKTFLSYINYSIYGNIRIAAGYVYLYLQNSSLMKKENLYLFNEISEDSKLGLHAPAAIVQARIKQ